MKELSRKAQALVDAGVAADASTNSDRARIKARLTAALGASAFTAVASQAAAMAAATGGGAAASGGAASSAAVSGSAAASSGTAASAAAVSAAAVSGAAASGAGSTALGAGAVGAGTAAVATTGWAATLGAKSVAWIGAAALSAAVGTTAVVTRQPDKTPREATVASAREAKPVRQTATPSAPLEQPIVGLDPSSPSAAGDPLKNSDPEPAAMDSDAKRPAARARKAEAAGNENASSAARARSSSDASRADVLAARSGDQNTLANRAAAVAEPRIVGVSATSFAALAAAADARRVAAIESAARASQAEQDIEEDVPQPTDPDAMNAVPATSVATPRVPARAAGPQPTAAVPSTPTPLVPLNPAAPALEASQPSTALDSTAPSTAQPATAATATSDAIKTEAADTKQTPQPSVALSGELELLARAQRALHDGKLTLALSLLDQHGIQHTQGSLREERLAARAVVLCRMQQPEAGRAEAQRLAATTPRSPLLPWVRAACKKR